MRKINSKSELGSMMIEAIAMLGLIAMVTPILYKKSAERTSELQDINAAGEIRSIIKAVDDYVGANYNIIAGKSEGQHTVANHCPGTTTINDEEVSNNSQDYNGFAVGESMVIPIGHLCEFLPYGILNADGTARSSKLFSDKTKIVLKMTGDEDTGQKVITSFVVTEPHNELPILRASSISSMIGGNGGYATEDNKVAGNMGIWGVNDTETELGVAVKKHAIVAASIAGISSQSATVETGDVDSDNFLYRTKDSTTEQRTMQNTLYMGSTGEGGQLHDIVNIKGLAVGADNPDSHALYIKQGDIQIDDGNIQIGTGENPPVFIGNDGTISVSNNLKAGGEVSGSTAKFGEGDNLVTAMDGILSAVSGNFGDGAVTINAGEGEEEVKKTTINQPLEVILEGKDGEENCTTVDGDNCALKVIGGASISGNLNVGGIFNAKKLHAQETLTVGGTAADKGEYLRVASDEFKFGNLGSDETGTPTISATNTTFDVTASGGATIKADDNNKLEVNNTGVTMTSGNATVTAADGNVSINSDADKTIKMNTNDFVVTNTNGGTITSDVNSFKVRPTNTANTGTKGYFEIKYNNTVDGNYNEHMVVDKMDTYFTGTNTGKSNVYLRDSVFRLQNSSNDDVVRIGEGADDEAQIDISGSGVSMRTAPGSRDDTKVLHVDLQATTTPVQNYPIYIRKGAIEMAANSNNGGRPYIQTDRLISTKLVESKGLLDDSGNVYNDEVHYAVDPAYTSIMHDIKLTTRGGARLSDILPDFINKGIYVVDNTSPAVHQSCNDTNGTPYSGKKLDVYLNLDADEKLAVSACSEASAKVSPWAGYVPLPSCPPGYSSVITVGLANVSMAQAGNLDNPWAGQNGYTYINDFRYAVDSNMYAERYAKSALGAPPGEESQMWPLYHQKNTWLKSGISVYPETGEIQGWDVLMGFIYPMAWFEDFIENGGRSKDDFDSQGMDDTNNGATEGYDTEIIWNLFPVYAGTIQSYATVYCYFKRSDSNYNSNLVDKTYDQMKSFRPNHSKDAAELGYRTRLKATDAEFQGNW